MWNTVLAQGILMLWHLLDQENSESEIECLSFGRSCSSCFRTIVSDRQVTCCAPSPVRPVHCNLPPISPLKFTARKASQSVGDSVGGTTSGFRPYEAAVFIFHFYGFYNFSSRKRFELNNYLPSSSNIVSIKTILWNVLMHLQLVILLWGIKMCIRQFMTFNHTLYWKYLCANNNCNGRFFLTITFV
jgi:hypothetical protein